MVVVLGILPAALGTYAFAIFMVVVGILGWREYERLAGAGNAPVDTTSRIMGSFLVIVFGGVALCNFGVMGLLASVVGATFAPVVVSLGRTSIGLFGTFQSASFGSLYLGLPVYSAILLRAMPGEVNQVWFMAFASNLAWVGSPAAKGLALVLSVTIIIWLGDTVAYLGGSTLGRRRLAPSISPGKTVEGSAAGLVAAVIAGAITFAAFGAGAWQIGAMFGGVVGVAGQVGDLAESLMKRQAGVKDSGTLIPGHGGILDRIDALLFAFPAALLTVFAFNWFSVL